VIGKKGSLLAAEKKKVPPYQNRRFLEKRGSVVREGRGGKPLPRRGKNKHRLPRSGGRRGEKRSPDASLSSREKEEKKGKGEKTKKRKRLLMTCST